jgi:type IV secretion system protein TrbL
MKPFSPLSLTVRLFLLALATMPLVAHADITSAGIFDDVHHAYASVASAWATVMKTHAARLFWTLALISMVWTFGLMVLRTADTSEFFAEFIRFTIFTGFFWWLLDNGAAMSAAIIDSLRRIGAEAATAAGAAAGHPATAPISSPSGIVDIGFEIFGKVSDKAAIWSPFTSAVGIAISLIILLVLTLVAVNMLLLLISGWILAYAGIFFLGFGGARWTSDMAIAYFKTVLGMGAQILVMVLLVGIGRTFIDTFYSRMSTGLALHELASVMVVAVILLVLINKLPGLFAGLVTGGGTGALGSGVSAGSVMAGAAMGAAAISTAGAALVGAAANIAGGAQAIMAAVAKGSAIENEGGGISRDFLPGQSCGAQGNSRGESSFAQAMGNDEPSASNSSFAEPANRGTSQPSNSNASEKGGGNTGKASTASSTSEKTASSSPGAKAARVAAGVVDSLVGGIVQMAKSSMDDRISNTTGGKVATAMRTSGRNDNAVDGSKNTISAGKKNDFDPQAEVAAFRDRQKKGGDGPEPPKA